MRIAGERAFVLHARPWRETSLLIELLTDQHGRVGAVARGVTGAKQQAKRAALQPWQHIEFDALPKGELWTLSRWEAVDAAPRHVGDAALAGFYVHELLLRLLPRQDAVPEVFARYAQLRDELRRALRAVLAHQLGGKPLKAWSLMADVARVGRPAARDGGASAGRGGEGVVDPTE